MVVWILPQLLSRTRTLSNADDQTTFGVPAFEQIRRRVADFGYAPRVGDVEFKHQQPDHVGARAAALDFITRYRCVNQPVALPTKPVDQRLRDVSAETGVERDLDAGPAQAAERLARARRFADRRVAAIEFDHPFDEVLVDGVKSRQ